MTYNYLENMIDDVKSYIEENIEITEEIDREELEEQLNDELWTADSVTGNASGSYTFSTATAKEYVLANMDLLQECAQEFCIDPAEIGNKFLNDEWEWFDVSIRCYLLGRAISEALDDLNI
jgi:hypothetical protein